MRYLEVTLARHARVWFDDELPINIGGSDEAAFTANFGGCPRRRAGLELRVRTGPRTLFGFIGCTFDRAQAGGGLAVLLKPVIDQGAVLALREWYDQSVRFGIPIEYRQAIFDGSALSEGAATLNGKVVFDLAAHDAVGSGPVVFKFLSRAILDILQSFNWPPHDDFLMPILARPLT